MTATAQTSPQQIEAAQQRLANAQADFTQAKDATLGQRRILIQTIHDAKRNLDKLTAQH